MLPCFNTVREDRGITADLARCTRNCYNCPSCTAILSIQTLDSDPSRNFGPFVLSCDYCNWTSLDLDLTFESPHAIAQQIKKLRRGEAIKSPGSQWRGEHRDVVVPSRAQRAEARFTVLKNFYSNQLSKSNPDTALMSPGGEVNYNSPSSLARIMSLYNSSITYGKRAGPKPPLMREVVDTHEGLQLMSTENDTDVVEQLAEAGWEATITTEQRAGQVGNPRFVDELWPVPTLLQTKRSRRCRVCRHILVKPDPKVSSTRYRIKLAAVNYIPSMTVKPLPHFSTPLADLNALLTGRPLQFLLTLTNPMFEALKITLATPAVTPGRFGSKVTILCPQFEIGASRDVWDEALGGSNNPLRKPSEADGESKSAEAGKVWDRGRNWTVVVLEVVGARIGKDEVLDEDEDVLEIPIHVRCEYEVENAADGASGGKEKKECAYWTVIGMGRLLRSEDLPVRIVI